MSPQGDAHAGLTAWLSQQLTLRTAGAYDVRSHSPFAADDYSEPEPDVVVSRRRLSQTGVLKPVALPGVSIDVADIRWD